MRHLLFAAALVASPCFLPSTAAAEQPEEDEATLKEAKLPTDTPALLDFFRKRTLPENAHARVKALIEKLGDDSFEARQKASADLIAMGPGIAPLLKQSLGHTDHEVVYRCREALQIAEKTSTPELLSAAARLLGRRKPPEAAKVLLDFVPIAESEDVLDALRDGLSHIALRDGKPDPVVRQTLADKNPVRRAVAAEVLLRAKALDAEAARRFLKDADGYVRLRTALALVERNDKEAVPVLIDVLPDVALQRAWLAEDVLCRLAGEHTPQASLGEDEEARKAARDAWKKWWDEHGRKVDLAKANARPPFLGLTVVVLQNNRGLGEMLELSRDGKPRWQFDGLGFPVDVQVLGANRFLVAEMNAGQVTERNRQGKVLWKKQFAQPVACQRLANGHTVIASPNQVVEVDAKGKEVFTYQRHRWDIMGARKHKNGEYVLLTQTHLVRIDNKGKEVKSFPINRTYNYSSFDVLPNGNLLLPLQSSNSVVEYTLEGKNVWQAGVNFPTSAQRLPNGNTLVASMNTQQVVEVDRAGKQVKQTTVPGNPWAAARR